MFYILFKKDNKYSQLMLQVGSEDKGNADIFFDELKKELSSLFKVEYNIHNIITKLIRSFPDVTLTENFDCRDAFGNMYFFLAYAIFVVEEFDGKLFLHVLQSSEIVLKD